MVSACFISMLIAALAGMGVGGGGLLVIYLTMIAGMETGPAQGVNLLFFIISAVSALPVHIFIKGRKINYPFVLLLTAAAVPGAMLGAWLAPRLPADLARRVFGVFLLVSGGLSLYKLRSSAKNRAPRS